MIFAKRFVRRRISAFAAALALLGAAGCAMTGDPAAAGRPTAERLTTRGVELERRRDYGGAEAAFQAAVQADPAYAPAHAELGELYRHYLGDRERAEAEFRRAIEIGKPPAAVSMALCGLAYRRQQEGRVEEAIRGFEEAARVLPTSFVYRRMAECCAYKLGDFAKAEELVSYALLIDPDDRYARSMLAVYLARRGETARAEALLDEILDYLARNPADDSYWYNVACVHAHAGRSDKAIEALRRHLEEYVAFDRRRLDEIRQAAGDPDLERLRGDPRFWELLRRWDTGIGNRNRE